MLAQLRVENQQHNQDGEVRREQLRNDIAKDECAHALPDARFTDRLRRHAERATASAVSPAYTADADHTGNASPFLTLPHGEISVYGATAFWMHWKPVTQINGPLNYWNNAGCND